MWPKHILFELKKYSAVISHDTEELCKFWRKTGLWFEKRHEKFANFHQTIWKCQNWDFDEILLSKVEKGMILKFTEELCVMTMKNNAKFEEELTCHFKTDMRNLTNFNSSTRKSKNKMLFNWLLWPKDVMFKLRKAQRSYVWWHWRLKENLKEKWLVLSKMTWEIWHICIGWNKWKANLTKLFTHV